MKIGLNLDAFRDEPLESVIPECLKMGIKNVELWASNLDNLGEPTHKWSYFNKNLEKAKRQLDEAGLKVCITSFGFGLDYDCCQDVERFKRELIKTIETAKYFDCPYVIHHIRDIVRKYNPDVELVRPYWEDAIKKAEELGVTLLLENEPMDMTCCPENMLLFLKTFDSPNFKCNFDAANYYLACNEPFPYAYEMLKPYIKHVHIKNMMRYNYKYCPSKTLIGLDMTRNYEGQQAYRVRLADGVLNNEGFLKALHRDGFDGVVSLENHGTHQEMFDMCSADADYLRATGFFEE